LFLRGVKHFRSVVLSHFQFLEMCKNLELFYYKDVRFVRGLGAGRGWVRWDRFLRRIFDSILDDLGVDAICVLEDMVGENKAKCEIISDPNHFSDYVIEHYGEMEEPDED